jgi:hypothetical protein
MSHDPPATPPAGIEPATFGLEVQRAIHCANGDDLHFCITAVTLTKANEFIALN